LPIKSIDQIEKGSHVVMPFSIEDAKRII